MPDHEPGLPDRAGYVGPYYCTDWHPSFPAWIRGELSAPPAREKTPSNTPEYGQVLVEFLVEFRPFRTPKKH